MDMTQSNEPEEQLEENPIKDNLWSITDSGGQVKAPPEDDAHRKFLKDTTWVE